MDFVTSTPDNVTSRAIDCDSPGVAPEDATREGCPLRTKRRVVIVRKGQCVPVDWEMRWRDGTIADLSTCFSESSDSLSDSSLSESSGLSVKVRFRVLDGEALSAETEATVVSPSRGLIRFTLPSAVASISGIYQFEAAVVQDTGCCEILFSDIGMLSVENGLWGDRAHTGGPPSLEDIRMELRDRVAENDLLQQVEFDDSEIIAAMVRPVQEFNECSPPLPPFNVATFPFRRHWTLAVIGELLRTAAHSYLRNKLQAQSGQLSIDDRNKNQEYLQLSAMYRQEWSAWVVQAKATLNASAGFGSLSSVYSHGILG